MTFEEFLKEVDADKYLAAVKKDGYALECVNKSIFTN